MLTNEAFNALLKTLEEPPKHLIFILATTEMEKLPQTILSRCQRFDFKRITSKDLVLNMKNICNELNISVEERALSLIARNSDGAMRDALSLLDQCISYKEELTYEDTLDILGIANTDLLFSMVEDIKNEMVEDSLFKVDEIIQNGKDINQFIKDLIYHFRNLLIAKTAKEPVDILDMDEETIEYYMKQGRDISLDFVLKALDILNESENQAKWATQPRIILEMAIIKMINLKEQASLEDRIKKLEMAISSGQINISKSTKTNMESESRTDKNTSKQKEKIEKPKEEKKSVEILDDGKEITFEAIKNGWQNVLNIVRDENIRVNAFLREGRLISFRNNNLCIGYKDGFGFHKEAISRPDNKEFVEKVVSSYFHKNIKVNFIMDDEEAICDEEEDTEDIQEVIDFFGEDIVKIKE